MTESNLGDKRKWKPRRCEVPKVCIAHLIPYTHMCINAESTQPSSRVSTRRFSVGTGSVVLPGGNSGACQNAQWSKAKQTRLTFSANGGDLCTTGGHEGALDNTSSLESDTCVSNAGDPSAPYISLKVRKPIALLGVDATLVASCDDSAVYSLTRVHGSDRVSRVPPPPTEHGVNTLTWVCGDC